MCLLAHELQDGLSPVEILASGTVLDSKPGVSTPSLQRTGGGRGSVVFRRKLRHHASSPSFLRERMESWDVDQDTIYRSSSENEKDVAVLWNQISGASVSLGSSVFPLQNEQAKIATRSCLYHLKGLQSFSAVLRIEPQAPT